MNDEQDAIKPRAGYYGMRMVKGGPPVGIRIWHGPPHDPETGEVMDRSWRWQAEMNGKFVELDRVWPVCAGQPISEDEYTFRRKAHEHALRHDAYAAVAAPRRPVDWDTASPPLF